MRRVLASRSFFWVLLLVLVAGADVLMYGHIPGWSLGLFLFLITAAIMVRTPRISPVVLTLNILLVGLMFALVLQPKFLSIFLSAILVAALAVFSRNRLPDKLVTYIRHALSLGIGIFIRWITDNKLQSRWSLRHAPRRKSVARHLLAWVIPLILGSVFVLLFSNANPVLELWIDTLESWCERLLNSIPDYISVGRFFFWILIGLTCWSLLRARRLRPLKWLPQITMPVVADSPTPLLIRCLLVFNVIFALQSILDGTFLWGHAALPQHMTYASYAHRGAYALVATALLAAGFIAISFRQIHTAPKLLRWLLWAWVVQNLFLMISTLLRLKLYVDVYSLSYWRIAAGIWMLLIALGFVWFLVALVLRRDLAWLTRANLLTCLGVLYVCCFPSFAGIIAEFNVRHCREMLAEPPVRYDENATTQRSGRDPDVELLDHKAAHAAWQARQRRMARASATTEPLQAPLDLDYVVSLGPEALPALYWLAPRLHADEDARRVREAIAQLREELRGEMTEWQSRTIRRWWLWGLAENEFSAERMGKD